MPLGPGKYDDLCTIVREQAGAEGVIVIVMGSPAGGGFSAQGTPELTAMIPRLLRHVADDIERSMAR